MKKIFTTLLLTILVAAGIWLVQKRKGQLQNLPTPTPPALVVEEVQPQKMEILQTIELLGNYHSLKSSPIATKIAGWIEELKVEEGTWVKKGELLVRLDKSEIEAQIAAQKAKIASLTNQIKAQRAQLAAARLDVERLLASLARDRKLYRAGAIAKELLEAKEARYAGAKAKLLAAQATLDSLQAQLHSAKVALKSKERLATYATIRAPYRGVVSKIFLRQGALAPVGRPILQLIAPPFVVDAPFQRGVQVGMVAEIQGHRCQVAQILPKAAQGLPVARIECPDLALPDGTPVALTLIQKRIQGYALPLQALYRRGRDTLVFVRRQDRFVPVPVTILAHNQTHFIPQPTIRAPVAIGSREKLAQLLLRIER
ncbi:MAG: hypothetical protein C6I00_06585 [Nitratiruptor sp.]|nr:hypothetical protein [Nitratiruptor sp.]NPA83110.1 biotin/lipoyl-binding protein [Campylobacterota bacterium]